MEQNRIPLLQDQLGAGNDVFEKEEESMYFRPETSVASGFVFSNFPDINATNLPTVDNAADSYIDSHQITAALPEPKPKTAKKRKATRRRIYSRPKKRKKKDPHALVLYPSTNPVDFVDLMTGESKNNDTEGSSDTIILDDLDDSTALELSPSKEALGPPELGKLFISDPMLQLPITTPKKPSAKRKRGAKTNSKPKSEKSSSSAHLVNVLPYQPETLPLLFPIKEECDVPFESGNAPPALIPISNEGIKISRGNVNPKESIYNFTDIDPVTSNNLPFPILNQNLDAISLPVKRSRPQTARRGKRPQNAGIRAPDNTIVNLNNNLAFPENRICEMGTNFVYGQPYTDVGQNDQPSSKLRDLLAQKPKKKRAPKKRAPKNVEIPDLSSTVLGNGLDLNTVLVEKPKRKRTNRKQTNSKKAAQKKEAEPLPPLSYSATVVPSLVISVKTELSDPFYPNFTPGLVGNNSLSEYNLGTVSSTSGMRCATSDKLPPNVSLTFEEDLSAKEDIEENFSFLLSLKKDQDGRATGNKNLCSQTLKNIPDLNSEPSPKLPTDSVEFSKQHSEIGNEKLYFSDLLKKSEYFSTKSADSCSSNVLNVSKEDSSIQGLRNSHFILPPKSSNSCHVNTNHPFCLSTDLSLKNSKPCLEIEKDTPVSNLVNVAHTNSENLINLNIKREILDTEVENLSEKICTSNKNIDSRPLKENDLGKPESVYDTISDTISKASQVAKNSFDDSLSSMISNVQVKNESRNPAEKKVSAFDSSSTPLSKRCEIKDKDICILSEQNKKETKDKQIEIIDLEESSPASFLPGNFKTKIAEIYNTSIKKEPADIEEIDVEKYTIAENSVINRQQGQVANKTHSSSISDFSHSDDHLSSSLILKEKNKNESLSAVNGELTEEKSGSTPPETSVIIKAEKHSTDELSCTNLISAASGEKNPTLSPLPSNSLSPANNHSLLSDSQNVQRDSQNVEHRVPSNANSTSVTGHIPQAKSFVQTCKDVDPKLNMNSASVESTSNMPVVLSKENEMTCISDSVFIKKEIEDNSVLSDNRNSIENKMTESDLILHSDLWPQVDSGNLHAHNTIGRAHLSEIQAGTRSPSLEQTVIDSLITGSEVEKTLDLLHSIKKEVDGIDTLNSANENTSLSTFSQNASSNSRSDSRSPSPVSDSSFMDCVSQYLSSIKNMSSISTECTEEVSIVTSVTQNLECDLKTADDCSLEMELELSASSKLSVHNGMDSASLPESTSELSDSDDSEFRDLEELKHTDSYKALRKLRRNLRRRFQFSPAPKYLLGLYEREKAKLLSHVQVLCRNSIYDDIATGLRAAAELPSNSVKSEGDLTELDDYPVVEQEIECYYRLLNVAHDTIPSTENSVSEKMDHQTESTVSSSHDLEVSNSLSDCTANNESVSNSIALVSSIEEIRLSSSSCESLNEIDKGSDILPPNGKENEMEECEVVEILPDQSAENLKENVELGSCSSGLDPITISSSEHPDGYEDPLQNMVCQSTETEKNVESYNLLNPSVLAENCRSNDPSEIDATFPQLEAIDVEPAVTLELRKSVSETCTDILNAVSKSDPMLDLNCEREIAPGSQNNEESIIQTKEIAISEIDYPRFGTHCVENSNTSDLNVSRDVAEANDNSFGIDPNVESVIHDEELLRNPIVAVTEISCSDKTENQITMVPLLPSDNAEREESNSITSEVCQEQHQENSKESTSAIDTNQVLSNINVPISELLKILHTASTVTADILPSTGQMKFHESYDYGHSSFPQNTNLSSCNQGVHYENPYFNDEIHTRDIYYDKDAPLLKFPIVHEYDHKSSLTSKSDIFNTPSVKNSSENFRPENKVGSLPASKENDMSEDEFSTIDSEFVDNSQFEDHDEASSSKKSDEKKEQVAQNKDVESLPLYKSRWERIMERKIETQSESNEKVNKLLMNDFFPVKFQKEKQIQKPVALVQPCSQRTLKTKEVKDKPPGKQDLPLLKKEKTGTKLKVSKKSTTRKVKKGKQKHKPSKSLLEETSTLFTPDKSIKKITTKNSEKTDVNSEGKRAYGRITNRGSFLTQTLPQPRKTKDPKLKKNVSKSKKNPKVLPDEFHLMINSPEINIASANKMSNKPSYESYLETKKHSLYNRTSTETTSDSRVNFSFENYFGPPTFGLKSVSSELSGVVQYQSPNDSSDHLCVPDSLAITNFSNSALPNAQRGNIFKDSRNKSNVHHPFVSPSVNATTKPTSFTKGPLFSKSFSNFKEHEERWQRSHLPQTFSNLNLPVDLEGDILSPRIMSSPLTDSPVDSFCESPLLNIPSNQLSKSRQTSSNTASRNSQHKHSRSRQTRCICLPPKTLKPLVGKAVFETFNVLLLILEWNVDWLVQQQKNQDPPPISNTNNKVRNFYNSFEEYYNTYLPLMLLETWQRIYVSWTHLHQASPYFCEITSYAVETHSIKVKCQVVFNCTEREKGLFPEEGNIIMVKFGTKEKGGIKILGYITNVALKAFDPADERQIAFSRNLKFTSIDHLQVLMLTFIGAYTSDDFDRNQLIRIQVLCNVKSILKQNDALLNAKQSPLFGNILNPLADGLRTVTMVTRNPDPRKVADSVSECIKEIIQGIVSLHPIPLLTIVKSLPSSDRLLVLPPLIEKMKDSYKTKVLLCTRTSKALADIGFNLEGSSVKVAIIGKRADVHQKLRKYLVDDLATNQANADSCETKSGVPFLEDSVKSDVIQQAKVDVLQNCDVILTLIRYCHDDFVAQVCADGDCASRMCCIIDEANLCTEPEILIPLLYGMSKLILIGDPDVPSKVCSRTAANFSYNKSLFHRAYELDLVND